MSTETLTLTAFLLERIAEDEAAALAASEGGGRWMMPNVHGPIVAIHDGSDFGGEPVVYDEGRPSEEQAAHIARHDPARVLAQCKAHRAIVEEHADREVASLDRETWGQPFMVCRRCHEGVRNVVAPCPTLRALASVYADHPSWREEWAL